MAQTIRDKTKLLHRIRRIRGQINAVEKGLLVEHECATILQTAAACRGAMDSLIAEIIEDHIKVHILDAKHKLADFVSFCVRERGYSVCIGEAKPLVIFRVKIKLTARPR